MQRAMLAVVALGMLSLVGCNTIAGMGQDIKGGGTAIENTATKTKDKLKGQR